MQDYTLYVMDEEMLERWEPVEQVRSHKEEGDKNEAKEILVKQGLKLIQTDGTYHGLFSPIHIDIC